MQYYNITWVTHNSRIHDRIIDNKVKIGDPFYMDIKIRKRVLFLLKEKIEQLQKQHALACCSHSKQHALAGCDSNSISYDNKQQAKAGCFEIFAINVLSDHVNMIIKSSEENIGEIIRNLKGYTSFILSKELNFSEKGNGRQNKIWAKHSAKTIIKDEKHLNNSIEYVLNNHLKHEIENIL